MTTSDALFERVRGLRRSEAVMAALPSHRAMLAMPRDHRMKLVLDIYRSAVRNVTRRAIRRGDIVRPSACEECGAKCKPDMHHPDYDRPLVVQWLCRDCHRIADIQRRARERETRQYLGVLAAAKDLEAYANMLLKEANEMRDSARRKYRAA